MFIADLSQMRKKIEENACYRFVLCSLQYCMNETSRATTMTYYILILLLMQLNEI